MWASVVGAAVVYAISAAAAVLVGCATLGFTCSGGANPVASTLVAGAALFATGLIVMGALITPAGLLLRRAGWLFWWTFLAVALLASAIPIVALCVSGDSCNQSGFAPLAASILFAGLCGAILLWSTSFRQCVSRPTAAVRLGAIFLGAYVAIAAATAVLVAALGGGERGMLFLYLALPWIYVIPNLLIAIVLNGVLAFGVGYAVSRIANR